MPRLVPSRLRQLDTEWQLRHGDRRDRNVIAVVNHFLQRVRRPARRRPGQSYRGSVASCRSPPRYPGPGASHGGEGALSEAPAMAAGVADHIWSLEEIAGGPTGTASTSGPVKLGGGTAVPAWLRRVSYGPRRPSSPQRLCDGKRRKSHLRLEAARLHGPCRSRDRRRCLVARCCSRRESERPPGSG